MYIILLFSYLLELHYLGVFIYLLLLVLWHHYVLRTYYNKQLMIYIYYYIGSESQRGVERYKLISNKKSRTLELYHIQQNTNNKNKIKEYI